MGSLRPNPKPPFHSTRSATDVTYNITSSQNQSVRPRKDGERKRRLIDAAQIPEGNQTIVIIDSSTTSLLSDTEKLTTDRLYSDMEVTSLLLMSTTTILTTILFSLALDLDLSLSY